jgi:hypothetical protein
MYPESFKMRHYLFLSVPQALRKYVGIRYDATDLQKGWYEWRAKLMPEKIKLPSQEELRTYTYDDKLDSTNPWTRHLCAEWAAQ